MQNVNAYLVVGSPRDAYLVELSFDCFKKLMDDLLPRCTHDETYEFILEVTKMKTNDTLENSTYSFGVIHALHLYNALLAHSIIVAAQHQSYLPNYSAESCLEMNAVAQLLRVLTLCVHRKKSFTFHIR